MLFNSIEFLLFFPIATISYYLVPQRYRWIQLLLLSCVFYAAFIPSYLLILFLLILTDYSAGLLIEKSIYKKRWLIISIISNIGLLGIFKYYDFFIGNINHLTGSQLVLLHWVLPIGLSFHTFQSLSYTVEVYRGKQKAIKHLGYYSLYVMFFPQLVAGPIERPQHLLPQLFAHHKFSWQNMYEGLRLMAWGFFKKVVVADRIGMYADTVFAAPGNITGISGLLAVFFFSIQIYADFSGYSDIALGAARCMGINLRINFNRPYQSVNIKEFWKRWHISLSSWFKEYVYIPLGGNKVSPLRHKFNLMTTFILSGFWHGASWNFLIWGMLHGGYTLSFESFKKRVPALKLPSLAGWFITMVCVGFGWIFFRADGWQQAIAFIRHSFSFHPNSNGNFFSVAELNFGLFNIALSFAFIWFMLLVEKITDPVLLNLNKKRTTGIVLFILSIWLIVFFGVFNRSSFIYFQF
ncbi:MAG: MBOAT family protein [Rhizobacter sp.]|nr:MBOAT family protein [Ferruginibacter sp.]